MLSRSLIILLGVLTLWPLGYLIAALCGIFGTLFVDAIGGRQPAGQMPGWFTVLIGLHMGTTGLMLALLVGYLVFLVKTDRVPAHKKPLWAVILVLGNAIAMPIFYFLYLLPGVRPHGSPSGLSTS